MLVGMLSVDVEEEEEEKEEEEVMCLVPVT